MKNTKLNGNIITIINDWSGHTQLGCVDAAEFDHERESLLALITSTTCYTVMGDVVVALISGGVMVIAVTETKTFNLGISHGVVRFVPTKTADVGFVNFNFHFENKRVRFTMNKSSVAPFGQWLRSHSNLREDLFFDKQLKAHIKAIEDAAQGSMDAQIEGELAAERAVERHFEEPANVQFDHFEEAQRDKELGAY